MQFSITEMDYTQTLESSFFSDSTQNNVIKCTNILCNQPAVPVQLNQQQFSCLGKEQGTGRACMRRFTVKRSENQPNLKI